RRQHDDLDVLLVQRRVAQRPQQIERAGQRELRRAEAGDEVPAPDPPGFFHRLQHGIDDAEAAAGAFGGDRFAREDAVTGEELLRPCMGPRRLILATPRGSPYIWPCGSPYIWLRGSPCIRT